VKFLAFKFIAFGPFTDLRIDLSQGHHGVHVIYGPNEAGKSAALRAISAALFGIPGQTCDNFVHEYGKLRIGATLKNSKEEELTFVRRKGNTATILDPDDPQGRAYPDGILTAYLASVDGDIFGRVYGIGHEGLRRGGMELKAMRGLVGESLFAAGLGVAGLSRTLETLDQEAREVFAARRAASIIRKYAKEYKQVVQEKRKAEVPTSRWEDLQRSIRKAQSQRDEFTEKLRSLRKESARLERLRQALPRVVEREQLLARQNELEHVIVLPDSYSPERRIACGNELQHAAKRAPRLREELEGANGLRARIAAITVPRRVLEQSELISKLHEDLGSHLKAGKDQAALNEKCDTLRTKAKAQLAELKPDLAWEDVNSLRLAADRKLAIQNMGNREKTMRDRPAELEREQTTITTRLSTSRTALEALETQRESGPLKKVLARVQKDGDLEGQLSDAEDALNTKLAEAERKLEALGLWKGSLSEVERLAVPLRETVDLFEKAFDGLDRQLARHDERECQLCAEADQSVGKIEALQRAGEVPTEEQLTQARGTRDTGWRLIRADWLEDKVDAEAIRDFAADEPLADAYESTVLHSDDVADRLRREASRVAELAQYETKKAQCAKELEALALERQELVDQRESRKKDWEDEWANSGISHPLSPPEMRAWLDRFHDLKRIAEQSREAGKSVERLRTQITSNRNELAKCLAVLEEPKPSSDETLAGLVDRCLETTERLDDVARKRADLQGVIAKDESDLREIEAELRLAQEHLSAWEAKWVSSMILLGCPADATAEEANARIALIESLFDNVDDADREGARIKAIEEDAIKFRATVKSLAERVASDLAALPAEQAAAELHARLDQAKTAKVKLEHLEEETNAKQEELADLEETIRERTDEMQAFCQMGGVDCAEQLGEAEKLSAEVAQIRSRLSTIDEELLELGQGITVEQLVADAHEQDADDLAARLRSIEEEVSDLEPKRDEVVGKIRELEKDQHAIDGSSAAAEADEKAIGILASMHEAAERYVRLRLASAVLRQKIEEHRTKAQDPLLSRASDLFAQLTCRSFCGLRTHYDENDQPVIVGIRSDGNDPLGVEAMSDGTQDQLYLALRLAYLEKLLERDEAMPFIVDDILLNFDDHRAAATLRVLGDLAHRTQVVFFTHHRHLVNIARATLSDDELFVHELPVS